MQPGEMVVGVPQQHISNMENGKTPIRLKRAQQFAGIFQQ